MRAPLSWLQDFAPFDQSPGVLAEALSNLGLVVDGVSRVGHDLSGIVVARVLATRRHPDADRIGLVDVDRGDGESLQICCGAFNMTPGDLVALATIGTVMPSGMEIAVRKMRGEISNGMLCSAEELGLPADPDVKGILILDPTLKPGTPISEALGLHPDVVFELDITPNRPDALSIAGVARDLAAALKLDFAYPSVPPLRRSADVPSPTVNVQSPDLCPAFAATTIKAEPGQTPAWMANRLVLAGMRPISHLVDVSNYVMLELGQPNHAYDSESIGGGLTARRARRGETVVTLDGVERHLEPDDLLIANAGGEAVGVAGIMGARSGEVNEKTRTVVLETAWFDPGTIGRTGKRLGLISEARSRFERGVDPELAARATERFASLVPGAVCSETVEFRSPDHLPKRTPIRVRPQRVSSLLGIPAAETLMADLRDYLGFEVQGGSEESFEVVAPSWRPDCTREIDVIEEVARLYGYSNIPRTLPRGNRNGARLTRVQLARRRTLQAMVGAGASEAWTPTFVSAHDLERCGLLTSHSGRPVELHNPLDQTQSLLRTSLLPGLLNALRFNIDRQTSAIRLFETGKVFERPDGLAENASLPIEREELTAVATGRGVDALWAARLWTLLASSWRFHDVHLDALARLDDSEVDRLSVSGPAGLIPALHPGRCSIIRRGDLVLGAFGELSGTVRSAVGISSRVAVLSVDLEAVLTALPSAPGVLATSRYPASDIDLAFVVDEEVSVEDLMRSITDSAGELLEASRLFDVWRDPRLGDQRRSLTFRLRFRAPDRTLTDGELAEIRSSILYSAEQMHGAVLRGA